MATTSCPHIEITSGCVPIISGNYNHQAEMERAEVERDTERHWQRAIGCEMSYKLIIAEELRDRLAESLPGAVLDDLSDALNQRLAVSPTAWSKPAVVPLVRFHQQFDHEVIHEDRRYFFRVFFKYGQDEQTLHIGDIRWI